MVAIQVILVLAFLFFLYKFMVAPSSYQIKAWLKIITVLFTLIAIGLIIFPNSANTVAHWFGVGRGADLLLYLLTITFIFTTLNLYIKDKGHRENISKLARKIALIEAEIKQKKKK